MKKLTFNIICCMFVNIIASFAQQQSSSGSSKRSNNPFGDGNARILFWTDCKDCAWHITMDGKKNAIDRGLVNGFLPSVPSNCEQDLRKEKDGYTYYVYEYTVPAGTHTYEIYCDDKKTNMIISDKSEDTITLEAGKCAKILLKNPE